jgi:cyclopropane-fatty-acyl-phospholipid synthase
MSPVGPAEVNETIMFTLGSRNSHSHVADERRIFEELVDGHGPRDFAVEFSDGSRWAPEPGRRTRFTIVFRRPGLIQDLLGSTSDLAFGEAYIYGDFDVEGDLEGIFDLADRFIDGPRGLTETLRMGRNSWRSLWDGRPHRTQRGIHLAGRRHSVSRDRQAISYHYDISNDYYATWLDSRMVYSCAYFLTSNDDLETAQHRKLDYVCRKLRLQPGERLLDLGCGWGGLVIHAAQNYGVQALGITLSRAQSEFANQRIRELRLSDRCRVERRDYRDVDEPNGFDKLACVGMFEHVGESKLTDCLGIAYRLLRPGGVFLNHGINRGYRSPVRQEPSFISRYVFPDGELVPITTTLLKAEAVGFEIRDVESLREHYALTCRHWVRRLRGRLEDARRLTDDVTCRIWLLYMAGSAHGFHAGRLNLYQTLLAKPESGDCRVPLSRSDWYQLASSS